MLVNVSHISPLSPIGDVTCPGNHEGTRGPNYSGAGLGPAVLRALPKLPLGRVLSHHKQEGGCFYVNNAEPWNAITCKYLRYHGTD